MTLLDLAARCESATGPSFALERDISEALGVPLTRPYTASIDAALMLVPEGWAWTAATYWCEGEDAPPYYADCADLVTLNSGQDAPVFQGKAATPALALCAAALRARAQIEGQEA